MAKGKLPLEKCLLALSAAAFIFLTVPAWIPGFAAAAAASVILCAVVWKLPLSGERIRALFCRSEIAALALVITSAFGCNFYNTWGDSQILLKMAKLLGMELQLFVILAAAIGVLAAAPSVTCALSYYIHAGVQDFRRKRSLANDQEKRISAGKVFLILFVIYTIGISAILRANMYYQDDAGRAAYGYKDWDYFGRYVSTALSTLIHMGNYLADAAPMPQLLAMAIMAASGVLLLYTVYDRCVFSPWELVAVVPLGLNPYFLECVSFRFDAPYMAISVLAAILPLLYRNKPTIAYLFVSMLSILTVCTSYQSATGVYPMLVVLLALRLWNQGKNLREIIFFCLKSVAGYGLGLLYFKLVIMKPADAGYVSNALPEAGNLVGHTVNNLKQYFILIQSDFQSCWLGLIGLLAAAFLVVNVLSSKQKWIPACLMAFFALVMMTMLCFGIYPVLAATLFAPRAMYGFGVLIVLLGIVAAEGKTRISAKLPVAVLAWAFFVFAFIYGNVLKLQDDYTRFRMELVMEDLNDMEVFTTDTPVTVQISGSIGKTPILDNMPQDGQILQRLVPETFAGGDDLTQYRFFCYYDLPYVVQNPDLDLTELDLPVVKDTMYHTIRSMDDLVLIELK